MRRKLAVAFVVEALLGAVVLASFAVAGVPSHSHEHRPAKPSLTFTVSGNERVIPRSLFAVHERRVKELYAWARRHGVVANLPGGGDLATVKSRRSDAAARLRLQTRGTAAERGIKPAAAGSMGNALILQSTVSDGLATDGSGQSVESQLAREAGFSVTEVSDATWAGMTTAQFEQYQLLIIGDPDCSTDSVSPGTEAEESASTWEPAVMNTGGNKVLVGTDPVFHYTGGSAPNGEVLIENGIAYAGARAGATGVYLDLSCTYNGAGAGTAVPILDGLSMYGPGQFTVVGTGPLNACSTNVNIIASAGPTTGLTDGDLSDWNCSVHEAFDKFPADYTPLAIAPSSSGFPISYCGTDVGTGTTACGSPYILVSGTGVVSGGASASEQGGAPSSAEHSTTCGAADPVNCATGAFWHTFVDVSVPGNGPALDLTRTYSSRDASNDGPFGYGWTDSYAMALTFDGAGDATVTGPDGAPVTFYPNGSGGYAAPQRVLATFVANGDGTYTYTPYSTHLQYVFNSSGELADEIDRNGYTTTLTYSGGLLSTITDPSGRTLRFTYSGSQVSSVTDPSGASWHYEYDSNGNLTSVSDPMGRTWEFTYDTNHLLLTLEDPTGGTTTNSYDASQQVIEQVDPDGGATTWSYDGDPASVAGSTTTITDPDGDVTVESYQNMQMLSVTHAYGTAEAATTSYTYDPNTLGVLQETDPDGNTTSYSYDNQGNLLTKTDPAGAVTTYTYNAFDEPTSETDALGNTISWSYDASGNLVSKTSPLQGGGTADWIYRYGTGSEVGDVVSTTDPESHTTTYGYDAVGDQTSVTDPTGGQLSETYDADGRRLSKTTADGGSTAYTYDADGELVQVTDAVGNQTRYAYNANGDEVSVTDPRGEKTTYSYDGDGNQTAVAKPDGDVTKTGYDADGNVLSQTDGNGNKTTYNYTPSGEVGSVTNAGGATTRYAYDGDGNAISVSSADGNVAQYTYDADNRVTGISYADGATPAVSYAYDADGQTTTMTDGTGKSTYRYSPAGQLVSETHGAGATTSYQYDADGNLVQIVYPNGRPVSYTYDTDGNMSAASDWLGNTVNFSHDADGNQVQESLPGGVSESTTYNADDALTAMTDTSGTGTLASVSYTRNLDQNVTAALSTGALSGSDGYRYDADGRLTGDNSSNFGYDAAANPTTYGNAPQGFNATDELTASATSNPAITALSPVVAGGGSGGGGSGGGGSGGGGSTRSGGSGGTTTLAPTPVTAPVTPARSARPRVRIETDATSMHVTSSGLLSLHIRIGKPGSLLVAFVSGAGAGHPASPRLHWRRIASAVNAGSRIGIWTATSSGLGRVRVDVRHLSPRVSALLNVAQFAPGTRIGAHRMAKGRKGLPAAYISVPAGGMAWAVGHLAGSDGGALAASGQKLVTRTPIARGAASWVENARAAGGGIVKIVERSSAKDWSFVAVAISPSSATTASGARVAHQLARLAATGSQSSLFTYTATGNRSSITSGGSTVDLRYNGANELTSVGNSVTYTYEGDGLRTSKTVAGTTTAFTWTTESSVPLLLQAGSTYYIYGPGGEPLEQITGSTPTFLLGDQQGSTRLLTDDSGDVVGAYTYDAWGNVTNHTGVATALQYDGEYTDAETGYQYLRNRYYDPTTGQFLTVDQLSASTSEPYSYTSDDPVNAIDPTGLFCLFGHDSNGGCVGSGVGTSIAEGVSSIGGEISTVAGGIALGAGGCALATSATIVGGITCGSIALVAGGISATSGGLSLAANDYLFATGKGCISGIVNSAVGAVPLDGRSGAIQYGIGGALGATQAYGCDNTSGGTGGVDPYQPYGPSDGTPLCVAVLRESPTTGISLTQPELQTVPL